MLGKTKNIDNLVDWAVYINSFQRDEKGLPRNSYVDSHLKDSYEEIDFISSSKESIKVNQKINIFFNVDNAHFFDAETGAAL